MRRSEVPRSSNDRDDPTSPCTPPNRQPSSPASPAAKNNPRPVLIVSAEHGVSVSRYSILPVTSWNGKNHINETDLSDEDKLKFLAISPQPPHLGTKALNTDPPWSKTHKAYQSVTNPIDVKQNRLEPMLPVTKRLLPDDRRYLDEHASTRGVSTVGETRFVLNAFLPKGRGGGRGGRGSNVGGSGREGGVVAGSSGSNVGGSGREGSGIGGSGRAGSVVDGSSGSNVGASGRGGSTMARSGVGGKGVPEIDFGEKELGGGLVRSSLEGSVAAQATAFRDSDVWTAVPPSRQTTPTNADLPAQETLPTAPSPRQYEIIVELFPFLDEDYTEDTDRGDFFDDVMEIRRLMDVVETRLLGGESYDNIFGESSRTQ